MADDGELDTAAMRAEYGRLGAYSAVRALLHALDTIDSLHSRLAQAEATTAAVTADLETMTSHRDHLLDEFKLWHGLALRHQADGQRHWEQAQELQAKLDAVEALCVERALIDRWVSVTDLRAVLVGSPPAVVEEIRTITDSSQRRTPATRPESAQATCADSGSSPGSTGPATTKVTVSGHPHSAGLASPAPAAEVCTCSRPLPAPDADTGAQFCMTCDHPVAEPASLITAAKPAVVGEDIWAVVKGGDQLRVTFDGTVAGTNRAFGWFTLKVGDRECIAVHRTMAPLIERVGAQRPVHDVSAAEPEPPADRWCCCIEGFQSDCCAGIWCSGDVCQHPDNPENAAEPDAPSTDPTAPDLLVTVAQAARKAEAATFERLQGCLDNTSRAEACDVVSLALRHFADALARPEQASETERAE